MKPPRINVFRMYRQRRFLELALFKYWWRSAAVIGSVVIFLMSTRPFEYYTRAAAVVIAFAYLCTDVYWEIQPLKRRYKFAELARKKRKRLRYPQN